MPLRNAQPTKFKPRGVVDSWDGMNIIPGGMGSLQNLIPDPSTPSAFQCRPAMNVISNFSGFSSPGVVSQALTINGFVYGFIASSRNSGYDEPFVYNITSNTFLTVQGITSSNVPATPSSTGTWVPPSMAVLGSFIAATHPGFNGTNGYFGFFDVSGFSNTSTLGDITSGSPTVTGNFPIVGVMPGYKISGTGIPANTRVVNVSNVTQTTTGNTHSNTTVDNVPVVIPVGSQIAGTGIPSGAYVTAISGAGPYSLTISQAATATATGITLYGTGTTITMSANATSTTNALSITVAGGTTTSPLWSSVNASMNGLTAVPTAVTLFYSRFYFSVANTLQYTDTLSLNRTQASQSLTAGDSSAITALSLFTLTTTTQGILQGLLAFKSNTVFQVTGDVALNTLAINSLNTAAGTVSPNSVVPTPDGVFFMAPDGIRVVQADGTVSEPDGDLRLPFLGAEYASRVNASYNSDVYRICVQNINVANAPWQEYWYDIGREIWTGPHTCQQDIALPYGAGFICFSHLYPATMYTSYVTQISGSSFTENGTALSWIFQTAPIGEDDSMYVNTVNETTVNMAFLSGAPSVTCTASDESQGVMATASVVAPSVVQSLWGTLVWGAGIWYGKQYGIRPHLIPWTNPLIFTKIIFQATATSVLGFKISNLRFMVQLVDYMSPL